MESAFTGRQVGRTWLCGQHFTRSYTSGVKKNELKPWLRKQWCIPPKNNASFVCAMEDVLTVYKRSYDPDEPVICMDETSKQLTKETRAMIATRPGCPTRYDYEYERNGVCSLFMFYEPFAGKRYVSVTDRRTRWDWAMQVRNLLEVHYPTVDKIILVMDDLNTHKGASLYEAFPPEVARRLLDRLEFHYTHKHGSWLNIAEIELSVLARQCLNRRIPDKSVLCK